MGDTCSTCNAKSPTQKTEIVHIEIGDKGKVKGDSLTGYPTDKKQPSMVKMKDQKGDMKIKDSQKKDSRDGGRNESARKDSTFELKQTTSFGGAENIAPTSELASQTKKVQTSSEYSLNTEGLKRLNEKYLSNLLESVKQKIETYPQMQDAVSELQPSKLTKTSTKKGASQKTELRSSVSNSENNRVNRSIFVRINKQNIHERYSLDTKIGQDIFGETFKGLDRVIQEKRAIKVIKKRRLHHEGTEQKLFSELKILRDIDHPNIIKLYDIVDFKNNYFIITEYYEGIHLLEAFKKVKSFTERHVANVMTQVLGAVNYLADKGIVHRDLKLEKIMLGAGSDIGSPQKSTDAIFKIIDFSTAMHCKVGETVQPCNASPYYLSPEMIEGRFSTKSDVWTCGVIMYILLSGSPPFVARTQKQIKELVMQGKIKTEGGAWDRISADAKDLLKRMIDPKHEDRISAQECLKHKWFTHNKSSQVVQLQILQNIEKFFLKNKFQAVISTFLASKTICDEDRRSLIAKFKQIDKDNSGLLDISQIMDTYKEIYGSTNQKKIREIIERIDSDQSGKIDLTEFMMATIEHQKLFNHKALENAWSYFDKDSTGYLDLGELGVIIGESTQQQLKQIMKQLGATGDRLSKQRFMQLFQLRGEITTN